MNNAMAVRDGPRVQDYLVDFFLFLRNRTQFRADHFRAPAELQRNLERMERLRIPRNVWTTFLQGAMRLVALVRQNFDPDMFVNVLFQIATTLVMYWTDYWILRAAVAIIGYISPQAVKTIVIFVYHFVNWAAYKLWSWIEVQLRPYARLALETLSTYIIPMVQMV